MHTLVSKSCLEIKYGLSETYRLHIYLDYNISQEDNRTERTSFEAWLKKSLKCQISSCYVLIPYVHWEEHKDCKSRFFSYDFSGIKYLENGNCSILQQWDSKTISCVLTDFISFAYTV